MLYHLNPGLSTAIQTGTRDSFYNSEYLDTMRNRYDIFINSEINAIFPFNFFYYCEISQDLKKAFGNLRLNETHYHLPKNRYVERMSNQAVYNTSSDMSGKFKSLNEYYFIDKHIVYKKEDMRLLTMLCVRTESIRRFLYNDIDPTMFVLLVDRDVNGGQYKTLNSIVKKYMEDRIDIMYTHDILANFNIIKEEDILNKQNIIKTLDTCFEIREPVETLEINDCNNSTISSAVDTASIY